MAELFKHLFPFNLQLFAENDDSQDDDSTGDNQDNQDDQKDQKNQAYTAEYVAKLRKEAAKHRTDKKKAEDQLSAVLKALGVGNDTDPDALKKQLSAKDERIKSLAIENAFSRVAVKLGADPDLTLAVLHRSGALDALDVEDAKFAETLEAEVKAALEKNPKLKATDPKKTGDGGNDPDPDHKKSMNDLIRKAAGR